MRDDAILPQAAPEDPDKIPARQLAAELQAQCGGAALEVACHIILALQRKLGRGMYRGRAPLF